MVNVPLRYNIGRPSQTDWPLVASVIKMRSVSIVYFTQTRVDLFVYLQFI
jgi:hypothetical protein